MSQPRRGIGEGCLVVGGTVLVPIALLSALQAPVSPGLDTIVRALVALAAAAWLVVVASLARTVRAALRGSLAVEAGPIGWAAVRVAALILLVAPYVSFGHGTPTRRVGGTVLRHPVATSPRPQGPGRLSLLSSTETARHAQRSAQRRGGHRGAPLHAASSDPGLLVILAADLRRRRRSRDRVVLADEAAVDAETRLLAAAGPPPVHLAAMLRMLCASGIHAPVTLVVRPDGLRREDGAPLPPPGSAQRPARGLALVLGSDPLGTHVLFVPRGCEALLDGTGAASLLADSVRIAPALGLGRGVVAEAPELLEALALREDDEFVVCVGEGPPHLVQRCVQVRLDVTDRPMATVSSDSVVLPDGRRLRRESLDPEVRALCDGARDRAIDDGMDTPRPSSDDACREDGVVVRLLTAVPRVDGLVEPLEPSRERRSVELLAYLALRDGEPVTGERLRVRVLGTPSSDAAAKTLFNVASSLRRSLGEGPLGPRLPPAGRVGRYAVSPEVRCDVAVLHARVARAATCATPEEKMAWLRAALELVQGEPFATVLDGYDWFLTEGHLARLQTDCEEAACELATLAVERGLLSLARLALDRAALVDPHSERLAAMAMRVAAVDQASFEAMDPATRSTAPSAPTVR